MAYFKNFVLMFHKIMLKEIFIVRNPITSQAAILGCSEATVHNHPFSKIFPENNGDGVLLLVKLQTGCSE